MGLTTIGLQKTPGRPIQLTFAPNQGLPSNVQQLVLIGHMGASGSSSASGSMSATGAYIPYIVSNVGSASAASGEVSPLFGNGSELAKMVVAAVNANSGGSAFPPITVIPLLSTDAGFGSAFTALNRIEAEIIASCYDGNSATPTNALIAQLQAMSGPQNVENQQFGTVGVVGNYSVTNAGSLPQYDTGAQSGWLCAVWKRDSAPIRTVGELAAAAAASLAANQVPFNPVDNIVITGEPAQAALTDQIQVGAGYESETALNRGWSPLRTQANGNVAWIRSILTRLTIDGTTPISDDAYVDVQDFQVLVFWRKTLWIRLNQPDLKQVKASLNTAQNLMGELLRLARVFEDQGMFQSVAQLAKSFAIERNPSDRSRFDVLTPVNVIPGLHCVAVNVQASTNFDSFSV
jgi:phage tail sheath gpL-like